MSDVIAIASRLLPWEAQLLRSRLEAAGLFAVVVGETDYNSGSLNNAQVLVREDDYQRAVEIKHALLSDTIPNH